MELTTDENSPPERSPEHLWNLVQHEMLHASNERNVNLKDKRVPEAAWKFEDRNKYYDIYKFGTRKEFAFEKDAILDYNSQSVYKSWLTTSHWSDDERHQEFVVLIVSADRSQLSPKVGDLCELGFAVEMPKLQADKVVAESNFKRPRVGYHKAFRIDNPTNKFGLVGMNWDNCSTFKISVDRQDPEQYLALDNFAPQLDPVDIEREHEAGRVPLIKFCDEVAFETHVWLDISDTTMSIELSALKYAAAAAPDGRLGLAFSYIRDFRDSVPLFNFFEAFPHMKNPEDGNSKFPESLKALYRGLDHDQKAVFTDLLPKLPARVGIIPGTSGSGKTQLMMTISALVLAQQRPSGASSVKGGGPVLYVMEANRLVNDAATRIFQLFRELGRQDLVVVRAFNLNYESVYSTRRILNNAEDDDHSAGSVFEQWFPARRADYLPQIHEGLKGECPTITIRDLIRHAFRRCADEFPALTAWVQDEENGDENHEFLVTVQTEWDRLLQKVLPAIDIMVTTVNGAAKVASAGGHAFQPRLVIFDEAARARELSTLVPISYFPSAEAWLFTGTCELSRPYVGSYGYENLWNPTKQQLRTPMMERAQKVVPDLQWLSLNHRHYGNLQDLPSKLFWDGRVRSAFPESERFSPATGHLLQYLQQFAVGRELKVPRLLVHTEQTIRTDRRAKSKYNHNHVKWVVQRLIRDLVQDQDFRSVDSKEPSIMIVTPYRAQLEFYRKAIKDLLRDLDRDPSVTGRQAQKLHRNMRVEARSTDTVQSSSAAVVVLDLVNWNVTPHLDDENRLCVSLTRASQAEIIVMHRSMPYSDRWAGSLVQRLYDHCRHGGQVVNVNMAERSSRVEKSYALQSGGAEPGYYESTVPRQLPSLPSPLSLSPDNKQVESSRSAPTSDSQPSEAEHAKDEESMFQDAETFGFEMVRKAMELGLTLSSDMRKGE